MSNNNRTDRVPSRCCKANSSPPPRRDAVRMPHTNAEMSKSRAHLTPLGQPPKRRKLSKAELREQAEAAFLVWREGQTAKDK
jgi:hypothetical protein